MENKKNLENLVKEKFSKKVENINVNKVNNSLDGVKEVLDENTYKELEENILLEEDLSSYYVLSPLDTVIEKTLVAIKHLKKHLKDFPDDYEARCELSKELYMIRKLHDRY